MFKAMLCATNVIIFCITNAGASELYIYEHNGSVIYWNVVGEHIKATYWKPRRDLAIAGIMPGMVVFDGDYERGRIFGKAFTFKHGCTPAPFDVIGDEVDGVVTLRGPAPVRGTSGCLVEGYSATSPNAVLIFRYSATDH